MTHTRVAGLQMTRRELLLRAAGGFGAIALRALLAEQAAAEPSAADPLAPRPGHFPAKADRVIFIFSTGGVSHVDTFDYKPKLIEQHGKPFDPGGKVELFQSSPGACMKSPWTWKQHGQCGRWMSSLTI